MTLGIRIFMAIEVTLCYIPGLLLRFSPFLSKLVRKQKKTLFIVYSTIILFNMLILFFGLNDFETATKLVRLDMLLLQILLVGANMIVIRGYYKEHMFTFGVTATCMYLLLSVATYCSQQFKTWNGLYQYLLGTGIYIVLMIVFYSTVRKFLQKTVSPFLTEKCADYWKEVWFIPMFLYIAMFLALPIDQNVETFPMLCSRLLIGSSSIIFCSIVAVNHQTLLDKQVLEQQLDVSKIYYVGLQSKVETARKTKHDLKHILTAVRHYIETNDKSGLSDFCDTVEEEYHLSDNIPYTGCAAVDGVLYHYVKKAEEQKIHFQYRGSIAHGSISDMDICILLGNALDNAFTGCLTIEKNRYVTLVTEKDGDVLSIMVCNSFDGKVNTDSDMIFSRKREGRVGVGLESMQAICEKYDGSMKKEWNEEKFTVLFLLTIKSDL